MYECSLLWRLYCYVFKGYFEKKNYPLQSCQILHFPSWKLEFSKYNSKRTRYFDGIYIIWIILQVLLYIIVDWERRKSTKSWWQTDRQKRLGIWEIAKTMIVHSYFIFYLCYNLLVCMFFNNFVKMHFIFLFKLGKNDYNWSLLNFVNMSSIFPISAE